ncbi:carbohydrate ABC transporter permease [Paenibacillus mendelii]|uniref:Carbohydrate ABC transporter permease n=1 Tax=Paenibacillus mendelii TaxID=206163 RepID=A0ABV6JBV6_9BACL|nr:carbohydrate ABC transporter permease [Paenibacillus mendelii]MCQ6562645.1 carbohydrate ABC transporter permease [Paenibacillus mendelii]
MVQNKSWTTRMTKGSLYVLMALITFLSLAPILYTVAVSFSDKAAAAAGKVTLWPVGFNTAAYSTILNDNNFLGSFFVSVKRVFVGGIINFLITVLMAYPLSRQASEFRFRDSYMWFIIVTMLFSGGIIPLYILMKYLGMFDTIWALVLPTAVPVFNVILLMNFFRSIPKELSEAGHIDGAGPWYMLMKVFIPLSAPALATVTLFSIVNHWNSFFDGLIFMRSMENYPLQTYIQQFVVQTNLQNISSVERIEMFKKLSNQTLNASKIVIGMLPILVIYPFLQRYFIHGIMLGSVKE